MNIVLLGLGIGMLSLIAPGPVNLSLIQIGARRGRRPALQGAVGVLGGDSLLGAVAVLLIAAGSALPATAFSAAQVGAAALLVLLGMALALRPAAVATSIDRMQRPMRAFFLLTSLTPTALAGWVTMLAAMPFASDIAQLAMFTLGVLIASSIWHPVLGVASSAVGARLSESGQLVLSRAGGAAMAVLGIGLGLSQI